MNERIHTLIFTGENGKMHRIEAPCQIPRGWQGGTTGQLENSARKIDEQGSKDDPRWKPAKWVLAHLDELK